MSSEKTQKSAPPASCCYLVAAWLRWRHGNIYAIKPPVGWCRFSRVSFWHKCKYWPKKLVWIIESWLHRKYGQHLRDAWLKSR